LVLIYDARQNDKTEGLIGIIFLPEDFGKKEEEKNTE